MQMTNVENKYPHRRVIFLNCLFLILTQIPFQFHSKEGKKWTTGTKYWNNEWKQRLETKNAKEN